MFKAGPTIILLALACLFSLCTALPPVVLSQTVSQTESNVPRTLLGKPYRRENTQPIPPPQLTVVLADYYDADADATFNPAASTNTDLDARPGARNENEDGGWIQTKMNGMHRVLCPFSLVVNAVPASEWVTLRLTWPKRPVGCCSNEGPWSHKAESEGMSPRDGYQQRAWSPVTSTPGGEKRPCDMTAQVARSRRGIWKSRLGVEQTM